MVATDELHVYLRRCYNIRIPEMVLFAPSVVMLYVKGDEIVFDLSASFEFNKKISARIN